MVSIPIVFTATEEGPSQLLGIATFASAEDENDVAALKIAHLFDALPLVSLAASVRPARTETGKYLVEVEVSVPASRFGSAESDRSQTRRRLRSA